MTTAVTAHMIVKNDDRFVWYAIQSVLPYVKELLIFDTGSTDKTVAIIQTIKNKKIKFWQKNISSPAQLVKLRHEQIQLTKTPWIWIIDADEIYPQKLAEKVINTLFKNQDKMGIILHRYDLLGDIYHAQEESVGAYDQFGKKGHYVLRLINYKAVPSLSVMGIYPNEYYALRSGKSIKTAGREKFIFLEDRYWHAMYLQRSTLGGNLSGTLYRHKYKIELGKKIKENIPEVFLQQRPEIVPQVTQPRSWGYELLASLITPFKILKRKIL